MNCLVTFLCIVTFVTANTEKVIFIAPDSVEIPTVHPTFDDLNLQTLTSGASQLRKYLDVAFPTDHQLHGLQSWYLLDNLVPGQRYELRVCWAAIQPTQFWLHTFTISEVFENSNLISGLAAYSESRLALENTPKGFEQYTERSKQPNSPINRSLLFLRVNAAADFYSPNKTLMSNPPAVLIDLILDPYLLNVFPESLVPTALYITVVAIGSWFLSGVVHKWLRNLAAEDLKPHVD